MELSADIFQLANEIKGSQKIFLALGHELRQRIILVLLWSENQSGLDLCDIAATVGHSTGVVSRHMQILESAGIVARPRPKDSKFYSLSTDTKVVDQLLAMLSHARDFMLQASVESRKLIDT